MCNDVVFATIYPGFSTNRSGSGTYHSTLVISEYSSCPEGHYDRSGDEIESVDDELRRDEEADERDWLDQPGDDDGTGWTNFDYSAAEELADEWDGDE